MEFKDKVVVIPGGGGGIGKAAAQRFLEEGAKVVLNSRRQSVLDAARAELDPTGERVETFAGDASDPAVARELIEAGARQALGDLAAVAPYDPGRPAEIRVEYKNTTEVDKVRDRRGVTVVDDRTIVVNAADWWSAWRGFFF